MPNYIRPKRQGVAIFFTLNLARRGSKLLIDEINLLRWAFAKGQAERPWHINAIVIMPDHLHGVMTLPAGDTDYATRWCILKGRFSRGIPKAPRSESKHFRAARGIWQRRYCEHHIRNAEDYRHHVEYCWRNPVEHGLVEHVADWPYSSFHRDVRLGRVACDWV